MSRSYYEHVESQRKPDAVSFDLIDWHDEDGIEVTEHAIPPPELARLMAETQLPEVES